MTDPRSTENQVGSRVGDLGRGAAGPARVPVPQRVGDPPAEPLLPARGDRATRSSRTRRRWRTSTGTCGRLFAALRRGRRCCCIVCSDHGTAYGEDGYTATASPTRSCGRCPTPSSFWSRTGRSGGVSPRGELA